MGTNDKATQATGSVDPDLFTAAEIDELRRETALVASGRIHLNHAGASPPPRPVVEATQRYLEQETLEGGYETAERLRQRIDRVYSSVARMLNTRSSQIALVENATNAFSQALASFDFADGDEIVTTRADYVSNYLAFLSLGKRRGVRLRVVEDTTAGEVDVQALEETLRSDQQAAGRVRLVTLSWMPTYSGLLQPAAAVGEVCRRFEVPLLLDACQVVGQRPIEVEDIGCDFLAATGRKYLRGPRGTGFLWVSRRQLDEGRYPLFIDLAGAEWKSGPGAGDFTLRDDARRFETWEQPFALLVGLAAAAEYAQAIGLHRIGARSARLAALLRERIDASPGCRYIDRGPELGAIVAVAIGDGRRGSARRVMEQLRAEHVHSSVTERGSAIPEFGRLGIEETLRLSPHYLNTECEIEDAVSRLSRILS